MPSKTRRTTTPRKAKTPASSWRAVAAATAVRLTKYIPQVPHPKQHAFLLLQQREAFYGGAGGGGKALSLDTPIPTPDGWSTMGELAPGDLVFDEQGRTTRVLAVSEIMEGREVYRVRFSDGEAILADADHLWATTTAAERMRALRRTPEWRARRRSRRPSRANGTRPHVGPLNSARSYQVLEPEGPSLRTTREIAATLHVGRQVNHAVAVACALDLGERELPVDPYILGLWLGDGTSSSGAITTADSEIVEALKVAGFEPTKRSARYTWGTRGLEPLLRRAGLLRNKHIPAAYLRASVEQRLALLQGLMDTDGTCCRSGACEFTTTSPALADGVAELVASLGVRAHARPGVARLNGREIGPKWTIKFTAGFPAFRLPRKAVRQRTPTCRSGRRYIVSVERVPSVPVRCIQVEARSGMFLAGRTMVPTHNSSALLMGALQYVDTPGYHAMIVRRTIADLKLPGALIPRSKEWLLGTDARWNGQDHQWTFPSGATLTFGYCEHDGDEARYKGAELQYIAFDELTEFSEAQYRFFFSRLRRLRGVQIPLRIRSASNPGGRGHDWVRRRFLIEGRKCGRPFIPARLDDNPSLDQDDYEQSLSHLDPITRRQILRGDWTARHGGTKFAREKVRFVRERPAGGQLVRYWDFAATEPKPGQDPDWTVGVLGHFADGVFTICDVRRAQLSPRETDDLVKVTAKLDGRHVPVWMEQEPGASGKKVIDHYQRVVLPGYEVRGNRVTGSKELRANPLSSAWDAGNVQLVEADWNSDFIDELEAFPKGSHDDQVDAASGAYEKLTADLDDTAEMELGDLSAPSYWRSA